MTATPFDSPGLRWRLSSLGRTCEVRIQGCADIASIPAIRKLEKELQGYTDFVFDVTALEFADSTFFRFLLRLRSRAHRAERRNVRLVGVQRRLRRVLEITGLARVFAYEMTPPDDPLDAA